MEKKSMGFMSLILCLVEIVIGILLLINPVGFTSGILIAFGIVMMIMGIADIVRYFTTNAAEAAAEGLLTSGLLAVGIGAFCTFCSDWLIATFPVITVLYGVLILVSGVAKLQTAIDMVRLKKKYWFIALIGAVLTLVVATMIICNPFASTVFLWTFIGVSLILEAVIDILAVIFSRKS